MEICNSRPINRGRDGVDNVPNEGNCKPGRMNRGRDGVDNVPKEGDVQGKTGKNKIRGSPQDLPSSSPGFPTPVKVTKEDFVGMMRDTECYWVYAMFSEESDSVTQRWYALDIKENSYIVRLTDPPMNFYSENASSVLDDNLYIIGGRRGTCTSCLVHKFDPVSHNWSDVNFSRVERKAGHAVVVDGRIYVFGGCDIKKHRWGEVYDRSTKKWTAILGSEALTRAHDRGLSPLRASAALGTKIILRSYRAVGIAFDVTSKSWTPVSEKLINGWWKCIRAAVVKNMLITCHGDMNRPEMFQPSIRAYDPDQDVWLMLEGIDRSFHENAHRSEFMSVNGKLVIYHMWEPNDLRFSIIEINERFQTTVRATLLWQSQFPITKIINEDLDVNRSRPLKYKQRLMEPFRADPRLYNQNQSAIEEFRADV